MYHYQMMYWHPLWHPFGMLGGFGHAFLIATAVGIALYFLPTIVARTRDVASGGGIFVVNLLFGWTMVGWVLCLFWAMLGQTRSQIAYRAYAGYVQPPPYRRGWF